MNSNYYFQKQQADEQIQTRLKEAEYHRQSKQGSDGSPLSFLMMIAIPLLMVGISVAILLLAGCTTGDVLSEESASRADANSETTMAERIHFQDTRVTRSEVYQEDTSVGEMTMAARILFQDKQDGRFVEEQVVEPSSVWTIAERIQFHDRIWGQKAVLVTAQDN